MNYKIQLQRGDTLDPDAWQTAEAADEQTAAAAALTGLHLADLPATVHVARHYWPNGTPSVTHAYTFACA